ncbi:unnamed protein product [Darwinula stevensoni]|uniref:Uncharacterized protein n=1 Tax=Darwinula stevensoni TaxID=69355 RepID=A0A7R9ABU7_9CRUS|nr:unnamed protein product [Darwinula stevensoni]CAG0899569.1 unnamed protein product [Darwinula stevensoni]
MTGSHRIVAGSCVLDAPSGRRLPGSEVRGGREVVWLIPGGIGVLGWFLCRLGWKEEAPLWEAVGQIDLRRGRDRGDRGGCGKALLGFLDRRGPTSSLDRDSSRNQGFREIVTEVES